jgi:ribosomal protein S7
MKLILNKEGSININDEKKKEIKLFNKKTYINSLKYKKLLQYIIKKGKKYTLENIFRKGILFWIQNIKDKNFNLTFNKAFSNTTPLVSFKTKRKGSKNINIPIKISENKSNFLAANWILKNALLKKKRNLYESIIEELRESSLKKGSSVKKRLELYKLTEDSLINLRIRKKKKNLSN